MPAPAPAPAPADVARIIVCEDWLIVLCALAAASMRCVTGAAEAHARTLQTDIACTELELSCLIAAVEARVSQENNQHPTQCRSSELPIAIDTHVE
jgi:hypothetical protein